LLNLRGLKMNKLRKLISDNRAKSKKSVVGIVVALIIGSVVSIFIFGSFDAAWGIIVSALVLAAIAVGVYYLLKAIDDVPEALN
jgi:dolichol kinase